MSGLTLSLLGSPCLSRDEVILHLRSRKCMALLAFLTVTGRGHTRASLEALLWPESDTARAQNALRATLSRLRRAIDGAWLVVDRGVVSLDGTHRSAVDVIRYRDLLAQCRAHGHPSQEIRSECRPLLSEAADLYHGGFMAGFSVRDSAEFDEWQRYECQSLRQEQALTLGHLSQAYVAEGDLEAAIASVQRLVALDPLREPAHRRLMQLYAAAGQRASALRHYAVCERVLRAELGEPPEQETTSVYEAIRNRRRSVLSITDSPSTEPTPHTRVGDAREQERLPTSTVPAARRHNLPPEPTPFVGRQTELAQIAQLLADPRCRLLSIVGPGGIGKSRLALRTGRSHIETFPHGVFLVSLGPLESPELLAPAIIDALGASSQSSQKPSDQLLNLLCERQLLLIMDNFEHLLEGSLLVGEILEGAPDVKLLVTSRDRLNLREEWLLPLDGLRRPAVRKRTGIRGDESGASQEGAIPQTATANLEGYSAIQLFLQCARRTRPDFSLLTAGASHVTRICQLVEGMPLAIELAAPWTRVLDCRSIAQEIEQSLGVLATTLRNQHPRHRSMRAVFDHSWGLLSDPERAALETLSVFRGGFRREAAVAVAMQRSESSAALSMLTALVDSSWLRTTPFGRYEMHPLIRQYCEEHLEQDRRGVERARILHSEYFTTFLSAKETRLLAWGQQAALEEILEDADNVLAAWNWATESGNILALDRAVRSLNFASQRRGWFHGMDPALNRTALRLRDRLNRMGSDTRMGTCERTSLVLAQVLAWQAHHRYRNGATEEALALAEEGLALLQGVPASLQQRRVRVLARLMLGWLLSALARDPDRSERLLRKVLDEATELGDEWSRMFGLVIMGSRSRRAGQYQSAEGYLREGLTIAVRVGDQFHEPWFLEGLARVHWIRGEYERAAELARRGLQLSREMGERVCASFSLVRLGQIAAAEGRYDSARECYEATLSIAREMSDPLVQVESLTGLAGIATSLQEHAEARRLLGQGLAMADKIDPWTHLTTVLESGRAALARGEAECAVRCFREALAVSAKKGYLPQALRALVGMACSMAREPRPLRAAEILSVVLQHSATYHVTRDRAQRLLIQLESAMSPEAITVAMAQGRNRQLREVMAEVLRESEAMSSDGSSAG